MAHFGTRDCGPPLVSPLIFSSWLDSAWALIWANLTKVSQRA